MVHKMTPRQTEHLLYELCVDLGFCLPSNAKTRLIHKPPADVDGFTDAVIRAEGLDPDTIPKDLRQSVRAKVAAHLKAADDDHVA
jgi:hypothetical protein